MHMKPVGQVALAHAQIEKPVMKITSIPVSRDGLWSGMGTPAGRCFCEAPRDDFLEDDRYWNPALHGQDGEILIEFSGQGDRPSDTIQRENSWSRQQCSYGASIPVLLC